MIELFGTVLKGISDGLSRGKKPEDMEKLVKTLLIFLLALNCSAYSKFTSWILAG